MVGCWDKIEREEERGREREGVAGSVRGLVPEASRCHNKCNGKEKAVKLTNRRKGRTRLVLFRQEPCEEETWGSREPICPSMSSGLMCGLGLIRRRCRCL